MTQVYLNARIFFKKKIPDEKTSGIKNAKTNIYPKKQT
jgi:hypothetical protein